MEMEEMGGRKGWSRTRWKLKAPRNPRECGLCVYCKEGLFRKNSQGIRWGSSTVDSGGKREKNATETLPVKKKHQLGL